MQTCVWEIYAVGVSKNYAPLPHKVLQVTVLDLVIPNKEKHLNGWKVDDCLKTNGYDSSIFIISKL